MATPHRREDEGFTLLEVVGALLLLAVAAAGVAGLVAISQRAALAARLQTSATVLAIEKLEQLRALRWASAGGATQSDLTTNLSVDPPGAGGGGLAPSPPGALQADTAGYVDYVDPSGRWLAGGTTPPPGAAYVRRWSIEPLADDPADTRVLRVRVLTIARSRSAAGGGAGRPAPGDVLMLTLLTRKAR
jgi:type II secretory pathway pseudopilin PulG